MYKHTDIKKQIKDFLLARGGPFNITEFDKEINDLNRELIKALYEDYKEGVELVNLHNNTSIEYKPEMKIFNFQFHIVRVKDKNIEEYLIWA